MERRATVEVFECPENRYHIVVEPPMAVKAIRKHLSEQEHVALREASVAGDLAFDIVGNKSYEDVLRGAAAIVGFHGYKQP